MSLLVRPSRDADAPAVRAVLEGSFPTSAEADLVERLERDGQLVLSFVAVLDDAIVGHVGFSRMVVTADDARVPALCLAPLAVRSDCRRRGIGKRLIEQGLAAANGRGTAIVFALGDPGLYGRFGFRAETAAPFASPYAGPHWLAQWLSSPRPTAAGQADHAPAFAALR